MPVNLYIGNPRSGKTYEVSSHPIYNAIKQGRRVLSNIAGLNQDEYYKLIKEENPEIANLGSIVNLSHEEPLNSDFWLSDDKNNEVRHERQIQKGDVLVLDEVWRFWSGFGLKNDNGEKRPLSVLNFFRMHGQMPHPVTGYTCEIVLITQDLNDIHRQVRGIVDQTFQTTKHTALGSETKYRLDVFFKTKLSKPISSFQRSYNSKYFALYSSHALKEEGAADVKEVRVDRRGNVLNAGWIKYGLPIALILITLSVRHLMGLFDPKSKAISKESSAEVTSPSNELKPQVQVQAPVAQIQPDPTYRIVGQFKKSGVIFYLVENEAGEVRHLLDPNIASLGVDTVIETKELKATSWTKKNADSNHSFMPVPVDQPPAS